ncbi:hypothetical protein KR009_001085 [Drosophila setifemur]|nr:hypothetical protein KR009_001085 [Drosophila setifemur]
MQYEQSEKVEEIRVKVVQRKVRVKAASMQMQKRFASTNIINQRKIMSILCPPMALTLTLRTAPPPPPTPPARSETQRVRRNLFDTAPGECNIDDQLLLEQLKQLQHVKETYNVDILKEERQEQDEAEVSGLRFPYRDPTAKLQRPTMSAGVAISRQQISASFQLIISEPHKSNCSTRPDHKPYARTQLQGVKKSFNVRKAIKGIPSTVPKSSNKRNDVISDNNNSQNNKNNNNVENGAGELEESAEGTLQN